MGKTLIERLRKEKNRTISKVNSNNLVDGVNKFMSEAEAEDLKILGDLGLSHRFEKGKEMTNEIDRATAVEKMYGSESFSGKQIKEMCMTYSLKFLPISEYKGNIPLEFVKNIREFCEKNDINPKTERYNFFILAPLDYFVSEDASTLLKCDPVLFYRQNGSTNSEAKKSDVFSFVFSVGNGFNPLRKFLLIFNNTEERKGVPNILSVTIWAFIFYLLSILVMVFNFFVLSVMMAAVGSLFLSFIVMGDNNELKINELWNRKEV